MEFCPTFVLVCIILSLFVLFFRLKLSFLSLYRAEKCPFSLKGHLKICLGGLLYCHQCYDLTSDVEDVTLKSYGFSSPHIFKSTQYLIAKAPMLKYLGGTTKHLSYSVSSNTRLCCAHDPQCWVSASPRPTLRIMSTT